MKIQIIGYSGAGKTTLAKVLAKIYNINNVLHLDGIHFNPNWEEVDWDIFDNKLEEFLDNNDSWIIEGNYLNHVTRRFSECDILIFLNFSRYQCFKSVVERHGLYNGIEREEIPGCIDKMDLEFINWVLFKGRNKKRRKKLMEVTKSAKKYYIFKNRKKLLDFIEKLNDEANNIISE